MWLLALFRRPSIYKHILGVAKDVLMRVRGSTNPKDERRRQS